MKINKGVEWSAHACTLLALLPEGWTLSADALADYHDVPPSYMAKQMQALSKAGLIQSTRGAAGGYCLSRAPSLISLWDITAAIEGNTPIFRCTEVRQNGPCGSVPEHCKAPCGIAASFASAEHAFREVLRQISVADMLVSAAQQGAIEKAEPIGAWIQENAARFF